MLLVDLRGHGESAGGAPRWGAGPHTLEAASADVLALLRTLRIFPYVLVGHSFGGKVVMSMCQQFGPKLPRAVQVGATNDDHAAALRLPVLLQRPVAVTAVRAHDARQRFTRANILVFCNCPAHCLSQPPPALPLLLLTLLTPRDLLVLIFIIIIIILILILTRHCITAYIQVWALDTVPGYVRAGDHDGRDHPRDIIATLRGLPLPLPSRNAVTDALLAAGASQAVARWAATNLRPASAALGEGDGTGHVWNCDLDIIADLYANYESSSMWPLLEAAPQGLRIDFVRAERSNFRWSGSEEADIRRLGHRVHVLPESGHWVHADNPTGLLKIIQPSFDSIIAGKI